MEAGKEDDPVFLDRASRGTRGKRMTKLLDEDIEEDEVFWNQEALKEEENDENYEEEAEVADVFDSDFDEDEPEADEEVENEPDDRKRAKKKLIFPGKVSAKKKKKKKVLSKLGKVPQDEETAEQSSAPEQHDVPEDVDAESERIVRKSTRTSVIVRQAERDAIRAAMQATMKPIKRKKEGEEKKMTQEEMLLEAAQTEIMNLRNLERVLAREEEVKKRAIVHKEVYSGPQMRYISRDGKSYLEFSKGSSFQADISTASTPYPERAMCAVTGLPAKYRDPMTGLPYATKEAFRIIHERLSEENSNSAKKKSMGILYDVISGQGFPERRKRSVTPNPKDASDFRFSSRFLTIPALESEASE